MSTPEFKRYPAKMDVLKKAKLLELYTIKKVCNEKHFSKKKYRRFLTMEIINLTKDCYTNLVKAWYCTDKDKALGFKCDALLCMDALLAQLDVANTLYSTPIPNMEYWAEQIVDVKDGISAWIQSTAKQ